MGTASRKRASLLGRSISVSSEPLRGCSQSTGVLHASVIVSPNALAVKSNGRNQVRIPGRQRLRGKSSVGAASPSTSSGQGRQGNHVGRGLSATGGWLLLAEHEPQALSALRADSSRTFAWYFRTADTNAAWLQESGITASGWLVNGCICSANSPASEAWLAAH